MMSTIFCDNDGCIFSDGCGFCDCDKLSIVDGVCEGSMHGGRNASDGDIDERLKAENAKLREFATLAWQIMTRNEPLHVWQGMVDDARELGIEEES